MSGRGRQADGPVAEHGPAHRGVHEQRLASARCDQRKAPGRLVEGAVVQGWKAALGALADV
jgi:hypothetical protein